MVSGIDHLVIAVPDLDAAAHELETRIGLAVTAGGRHEGMGTSNRIAFLADGSYLELITIDDSGAAGRWPVGATVQRTLAERGGGLAAYALRDEHLQATVDELRANGSSLGDVVHGSRRRDDGELVEWWTSAPARIGLEGTPFLIRHAEAGAEWGPEAMVARRSFRHPIGSAVVLVRLDIATPDPSSLAALYAAELGVDFWAVVDLAVTNVGRHVVRLVPSREMDVPAALTLGARVDAPRSSTLLGLRIDVEPVDAPAAVPP